MFIQSGVEEQCWPQIVSPCVDNPPFLPQSIDPKMRIVFQSRCIGHSQHRPLQPRSWRQVWETFGELYMFTVTCRSSLLILQKLIEGYSLQWKVHLCWNALSGCRQFICNICAFWRTQTTVYSVWFFCFAVLLAANVPHCFGEKNTPQPRQQGENLAVCGWHHREKWDLVVPQLSCFSSSWSWIENPWSFCVLVLFGFGSSHFVTTFSLVSFTHRIAFQVLRTNFSRGCYSSRVSTISNQNKTNQWQAVILEISLKSSKPKWCVPLTSQYIIFWVRVTKVGSTELFLPKRSVRKVERRHNLCWHIPKK